MTFALDHVREAVFLIDATGHFRYVNEEACRLLGYSAEELLTLAVPDVDPDFSRERWLEHRQMLGTAVPRDAGVVHVRISQCTTRVRGNRRCCVCAETLQFRLSIDQGEVAARQQGGGAA